MGYNGLYGLANSKDNNGWGFKNNNRGATIG